MENTEHTEHMVKCICHSIHDKKNYLSKYYDHNEVGYLFDFLDMKKEIKEQIIQSHEKLFNKKIKSIRDLPSYISCIRGTCIWFETDDHIVFIGPYKHAIRMFEKR